MRVLDGGADRAEEFEARRDRKFLFAAVGGDGLAFDVFHYQIMPTFFGRAAVQQPCDVWMVESRQNLALSLEALHRFTAKARPDEFDGDLLGVSAVRAFGQKDRAHPAAPDFAYDAIAADAVTDGCRRV